MCSALNASSKYNSLMLNFGPAANGHGPYKPIQLFADDYGPDRRQCLYNTTPLGRRTWCLEVPTTVQHVLR